VVALEPASSHEYHTFNQPRERFTIESSQGDFVFKTHTHKKMSLIESVHVNKFCANL
jgi:hypothetical protein